MIRFVIFSLFLLASNISIHAVPIGILPFHSTATNNEAESSDLSGQPSSADLLSSTIITAMQKAGRFEIVEQGRINALLDEMARAQDGSVDVSSAAQIGQLVGAQYLVMGSYNDKNQNFEAAFRVVHVETGLIIAADRFTGNQEVVIDKLQSSLIRQLDLYLGLDNPQSPYTILLKINDAPLKIGNTLQLKFKVLSHSQTAPKKVYVQLYSINAKGVMTLIYPNRFSGFSPLNIDQEYEFPSAQDDFEWQMVPPIGVESIQALATTEPVDLFNTFTKARSTFPETGKNGKDPITYRGIQIQLNQKKRKDWKSQRISYELTE